jgi:hypothetical protein
MERVKMNRTLSALIGTSVVAAGLGLAMSAMPAQAFNLSAYSLETNGDPDADASKFGINLAVNGDGTATFSFANNLSAGEGTITSIFFGTENNPGFDDLFSTDLSSVTLNGTGVNYSIANSGPNPGFLGWGIELWANPSAPPTVNGVNPGDVLNVTFDLLDSNTSLDTLLGAFNTDPAALALAFHVQQIGTQDYSEWYGVRPKTSVPEPGTTAALGLFALTSLGLLRKVKKS